MDILKKLFVCMVNDYALDVYFRKKSTRLEMYMTDNKSHYKNMIRKNHLFTFSANYCELPAC